MKKRNGQIWRTLNILVALTNQFPNSTFRIIKLAERYSNANLRLFAYSWNAVQASTSDEFGEIVQVGQAESLIKYLQSFDPDAINFQQVKRRFGNGGFGFFIGVKGSGGQQVGYLFADRLADAGKFAQAGNSGFGKDFGQRLRPVFNRVSRRLIRPNLEEIFAAKLQ